MVLGGSRRARAAGSVGLGKTVESEAVWYVVDRQLLVARWVLRPSLETFQVMLFDRVRRRFYRSLPDVAGSLQHWLVQDRHGVVFLTGLSAPCLFPPLVYRTLGRHISSQVATRSRNLVCRSSSSSLFYTYSLYLAISVSQEQSSSRKQSACEACSGVRVRESSSSSAFRCIPAV